MGNAHTDVGPRYSEGARLLAEQMRAREWSQGELRRHVGVAPGVVSRWLYGEKRPSAVWAARIEEVTGVPASAWGKEPSRATKRRRAGTDR